MPNLKDIRNRIQSVKNTRKITSAMKMVSVAKLRRAQERAEESRPYAVKMAQVIASLVSRVDPSRHALLERRDVQDDSLLIVVSSNRGLCGGYNANLFRAADRFITERENQGEEVHLVTLGRKARQYYRRRPVSVWKDYPDVIGDITFKKARRIAQDAIDAFIGKTFDNVYVEFNEFVSAIQYETIVEPLLPLTLEDLGVAAEDYDPEVDEEGPGEYLFEPGEDELLSQLLPNHIEVQIYRALLEAEASEHGARMTAMDNATSNAEDMIEDLTLQYNRARQAYITKELVEIVSGAEALEG